MNTEKSFWVWSGLIFLDCKLILLTKVWLVRLGSLLEHLCLVEKTEQGSVHRPLPLQKQHLKAERFLNTASTCKDFYKSWGMTLHHVSVNAHLEVGLHGWETQCLQDQLSPEKLSVSLQRGHSKGVCSCRECRALGR